MLRFWFRHRTRYSVASRMSARWLSSEIVFVRHRELRHREGFTPEAIGLRNGSCSGDVRVRADDGDRSEIGSQSPLPRNRMKQKTSIAR